MRTRAFFFVVVAAAAAALACIDWDGALDDCRAAGRCAEAGQDGGGTQDSGSAPPDGGVDSGTPAEDAGTDADAGADAGTDAGTQDAGICGGAWCLYSAGSSGIFEVNAGVWATGPNDAYGVSWGSYVLRWNGATWTKLSPDTLGNDWNAIWGYGDVLIVGGGNAAWSIRQNNIWSKDTYAPEYFKWIHGLPDGGSIYAAMSGPSVGALDGGAWDIAWRGGTSSSRTATGVFVVAQDDVWATGTDGLLVHYDGLDWNVLAPGVGAITLFRVWASGPGDVWIVGEGGVVLHWNGSALERRDYPGPNLRGVWGTGPDQVWAAGEQGTLIEWRDGGWEPIPVAGTPDFLGLWGGGPNDLFLSGGFPDGGQGVSHYRR